MNKVFWLQPKNTQLGEWQEKITTVSGSHSFCVIPWIHLATRPNGDMRLCCGSNASGVENGDYTIGLVKNQNGDPVNFSKELPVQAFNNNFMKTVRRSMLDGNIPNSCKKCFDEESRGIASKRIWETGTWFYDEHIDIPDLIAQTAEDGSVPYKLQYLDLRLGHTCNLKCIMCSPHDSSMWVPEHKKIYPIFQSPVIKKQMDWAASEFNNYWHENPAFWEQIYEQISNIKQIYFAGGEPLAIKEHKLFLKEIIHRGYADKILLRYNTNGLLINNEIIDLWEKFRRVKIGLSIDAIEDRLYYIRYPTKWQDVLKVLNLLDNTSNHIEINIAFAIQILNIKHVPDFIKWKVKSNFKKINLSNNAAGQKNNGGLISAHLVWIPTWLNLRILPMEDKQDIRKLFEDLRIWLKENYITDDEFYLTNPYGWKRWEGILNWMDSEDQSYLLKDFKEYINVMDIQRGTNFKTIFPELSHLI